MITPTAFVLRAAACAAVLTAGGPPVADHPDAASYAGPAAQGIGDHYVLGDAGLDGAGLDDASPRFRTVPPPGWASADPADSLYREARTALNRGDYGRAAELFRRVWERYPDSAYAGDALYWEAFALYKRGRAQDLRLALGSLKRQQDAYADAGTLEDAPGLAVRICGELARRGDEECARTVTEIAKPERERIEDDDRIKAERDVIGGDRARQASRPGGSCPREDDDLRIAALNALQQMNADQALPILREVLDKRDACSVGLRRKAVFLVAQTNSSRAGDILLDVIRTDPDGDVRREAVFWLSQVPGERTVSILDSLLRESRDREIQDKAIFALSQHKSSRAGQILRDLAERTDVRDEIRAKAIFALGHHRGRAEDGAFLRELYPGLRSSQLKEQVIQAIAQVRGPEVDDWLMGLARNRSEDIETRKKALFWAGQRRGTATEMIRLYETVPEREINDHLIWVLSQQSAPAATDKLISIARTEPDRELRKKAIFWLGQKNDPRVKQLLMEIINTP